MPKTVTLRLDEKTYERFLGCARADNRTLANFLETAVCRYIEESSLADDAEMAEILSNEELLRKLKKGSDQARRKKGRFVE